MGERVEDLKGRGWLEGRWGRWLGGERLRGEGEKVSLKRGRSISMLIFQRGLFDGD